MTLTKFRETKNGMQYFINKALPANDDSVISANIIFAGFTKDFGFMIEFCRTPGAAHLSFVLSDEVNFTRLQSSF